MSTLLQVPLGGVKHQITNLQVSVMSTLPPVLLGVKHQITNLQVSVVSALPPVLLGVKHQLTNLQVSAMSTVLQVSVMQSCATTCRRSRGPLWTTRILTHTTTAPHPAPTPGNTPAPTPGNTRPPSRRATPPVRGVGT